MTRSARIRSRRIRQTFAFDNPGRVLLDLATSRSPWRRDALVFELAGGGRISVPNHPGARVPVYEIFVEDSYHLLELTRGLGDGADLVVVDIGGHIGCFSIDVARRIGGARVHTYEASPFTVEWLRRNVADNGLGERVHVHPCALSDHRGTLSFVDDGRGSGLNGSRAATSPLVEVPCVTFDDVVTEAGGRVDLVKLDTEGAEYDIVLSSTRDSWASVQRVVLEYHVVPGHRPSELEEHFVRAGLHVTDRVGDDRVGTLWLSRPTNTGAIQGAGR